MISYSKVWWGKRHDQAEDQTVNELTGQPDYLNHKVERITQENCVHSYGENGRSKFIQKSEV